MSNSYTASWQVEDGYAGPSRPQTTEISDDIVEDHMSDSDLETALHREVRDAFNAEIDFFISNEDDALAWMRECRDTLKKLEDEEDFDTDAFEGKPDFTARWGVDDGYAGSDRPRTTDISPNEIESDMDDERLKILLRQTVREDFEQSVDFVITNQDEILEAMIERRDEILEENAAEDEEYEAGRPGY